ncbi:MAG TPA: hypothetical protein VFS64_02040 [Solirubrobacterales bacterium]|nr:hypothetical protein [Solirubrobacterales bacterium]
MRRRTALFLALVLLLLPAPAARASYDPLGSGVTRLALDQRFAAFLNQAGVRVSTQAGAAKRGRALVFPISGGRFDPTAGAGEVEQQGSLALRSARSRVLMRKLVVKTTHSPLVAKVGGSQLKVATSAAIGSRRNGFGVVFSARKLQLTEKVATRLNKKLRPRRLFSAGQLVGTLVSEPQPLVTAIVPTGRATLTFDSAFMAKLDQHFASVNPVFPAEHVGPTFTLPIIANGALAPDASQGTLRTGGEIEFLELGAGQVFWHELWFDIGLGSTLAEVDLEPTPAFPGKLGQKPVLALGTGARAADSAARTISLDAAPLTLTAETAASFNQAFAEGRSEFSVGELVGTLSFTAQAQ